MAGHGTGAAVSSFPFPALAAVRCPHWTIAHEQDCFCHGQHWKAQQTRGSAGWGSRGVPGQMRTWTGMQTLLFCQHLTPACWLRRGRLCPGRGPSALRALLAAFAALERSPDTNRDSGGELCTVAAAGEARPRSSVLGTVPWSPLSLVIFSQGSNA